MAPLITTNTLTWHNIFATWQGWSDLVIPTLGAVCIPLLILFLTWFFGSVRAEKIKQHQEDIEKLSYLRSLMYYTLSNLLVLQKLLKRKQTLLARCCGMYYENYEEKVGSIRIKDTYSQFEPQQYVNFLEIAPNLVMYLLDVKKSLIAIFLSVESYNQNITKRTIVDARPLLQQIEQDLINVSLQTDCCIAEIKKVLQAIRLIEVQKNLKLVQIGSDSRNVKKF